MFPQPYQHQMYLTIKYYELSQVFRSCLNKQTFWLNTFVMCNQPDYILTE